jgi:hypothetical protein
MPALLDLPLVGEDTRECNRVIVCVDWPRSPRAITILTLDTVAEGR